MRVMFLGDVEASLGFMLSAIEQARQVGVEAIVQAGDLGVQEQRPGVTDFLDETNRALTKAEMWCTFVDGNHENFDALECYPRNDDGFRIVRERIWHAPRGHIFDLDGLSVLAFGGASSPNGPDGPAWFEQSIGPLPDGTDLGHWWPQEVITPEDVRGALDNLSDHGPVDVMVSHECPAGVGIPGITGYPAGDDCRQAVREVMGVAKPQLLVCGHYHRRLTTSLKQTRVEILSSSAQPSGQGLFIETDGFTIIGSA